MSVRLKVDATRIATLAESMRANAKEMDAAQIRALNKATSWLRIRGARAISKEAKFAVRLARQRIAAFKANRRKRSGKVWAGLEPIKAHRLGAARQTRAGVRAGRHMFDGAFLVDTGHGNFAVFQRTGEAKTAPTKGRYAGTGIKREPIERAELDVDTEAVRSALDKLFQSAQQVFLHEYVKALKARRFLKNAR